MITRIFPLLAACVLFGGLLTSAAQAGDVKQTVAGSSFMTARDSNGDGVFAAEQNLAAKGKPGTGEVQAVTEFGSFMPSFPGCPEGFVGADLVALTFVETFTDQSLLSGTATSGIACIDVVTGGLVAEIWGILTGGSGRFEGVSGSFHVTAEAQPANLAGSAARLTGTVEADFDDFDDDDDDDD